MNECDALWLACLDNPNEETPRLALADLLQEHGFADIAEAMRGPAGRAFVRVAADPPAGDAVMRLRVMTPGEREEAVRDAIEDTIHEVIDGDYISSELADTNAVGWSVDNFDIEQEAFVQEGYRVEITFYASGDQLEDRVFCGDRLQGTAQVTINASGNVTYEVTQAEIEDYTD